MGEKPLTVQPEEMRKPGAVSLGNVPEDLRPCFVKLARHLQALKPGMYIVTVFSDPRGLVFKVDAGKAIKVPDAGEA